jgi:hypothetical protein
MFFERVFTSIMPRAIALAWVRVTLNLRVAKSYIARSQVDEQFVVQKASSYPRRVPAVSYIHKTRLIDLTPSDPSGT